MPSTDVQINTMPLLEKIKLCLDLKELEPEAVKKYMELKVEDTLKEFKGLPRLKEFSDFQRFTLKEVVEATNNFDYTNLIGTGGFGNVYKGELIISEVPTMLAVKRIDWTRGQGLKEFMTEIHLLAGHKHKNVISLLGYCDEGMEKILVYEYAARGSLDTYIRRDNDKKVLSWKKILEICTGAARGLSHLHSNSSGKRIIHRDIKSANILLDEDWVAKISDFGLSKLISDQSSVESVFVSNACGTGGYCAPEYQNNGILKKECDVYSFGIVLFELLCGRLCSVPYEDGFVLSGPSIMEYYEKNKLNEIIDPRLRGEVSSHSINKFSEVAYKCLLKDERQRPSMECVVKELEELLQFV